MENETSELLQYLKTYNLKARGFETRTDRYRGVYIVHAEFTDGRKFDVQVSDREAIAAIKALSQENLKRQFADVSEFKELLGLPLMKRYTIACMGDFGFCYSLQFTLANVTVGTFAQYDDCVTLIFKAKGARNLRSMPFYGTRRFAIWTDWHDVNTNAFGPEIQDGPFVTKRSRYLSFDERFLIDAIASVPEKPRVVRLLNQTIDVEEGCNV